MRQFARRADWALRAILALIALALPGNALADRSVEGIWHTDVRDGVMGVVRVAPCGPALCGTILHGIDRDGAQVFDSAGQQVIRGMLHSGPGYYEGEVIDPRNGRVYIGRLQLSGATMELRGCVLGGLICGSSTWTRAN